MWPRLAAVTRVEIVPIGSYIVKGDDAPQGERRHLFFANLCEGSAHQIVIPLWELVYRGRSWVPMRRPGV